MRRKYRGWFGQHARRRCPHARKTGIYGDQIIHCGFWRLVCEDCGQFLDGPVSLADPRRPAYVPPPGYTAAGDDTSTMEIR